MTVTQWHGGDAMSFEARDFDNERTLKILKLHINANCITIFLLLLKNF